MSNNIREKATKYGSRGSCSQRKSREAEKEQKDKVRREKRQQFGARNAARHEETRVFFYSQQILSEAQQMFLISFASFSLLLCFHKSKEFAKR